MLAKVTIKLKAKDAFLKGCFVMVALYIYILYLKHITSEGCIYDSSLIKVDAGKITVNPNKTYNISFCMREQF